ncbi:hypothetical protein B6D52_03210 [Candidatus Parcubacteria bacterium 4484_255]|nr:MAG: hypothetical protein B6D52_03210 [Candidatus Parcubacteria bacterium 4484_255]
MKYHIITYGCQMNKSDSERMASVLENAGYKSAPNINGADLIIVNMCSVRQSAVDRVYGLSKKLANLKKNKPKLKTILTGCILETDRKKMKNKFDQIISNQELNHIIPIGRSALTLPIYSSSFSAYVPIMTGCNNFCSYCVVPYTRGREYSRPASEIISEVQRIIKKGYLEIILLGQNVNSYKNKKHFPELLKDIQNIPGNFWISFLTSHPKDFSDELIKVMANSSKICHYLHLAVQSGDDQILKKMNRNYTVGQYEKIIYKVRKIMPQINISTDIIVGFPGETKKQFANTKKLMQKIKFDMAYIAQYSPRPHTKAFQLKDNISAKEKKERAQILNQILKKTALQNNQKYIGKKVKALVVNPKQAKTKTLKKIRLDKPAVPGTFISCQITHAQAWKLIGHPLNTTQNHNINSD